MTKAIFGFERRARAYDYCCLPHRFVDNSCAALVSTIVLARVLAPAKYGVQPRVRNGERRASGLPMAKFWGGGVTASSDGQFFPAARQGDTMNLINAKYGSEPGLKAYTHVSDQFGPFATQNIPATVSDSSEGTRRC